MGTHILESPRASHTTMDCTSLAMQRTQSTDLDASLRGMSGEPRSSQCLLMILMKAIQSTSSMYGNPPKNFWEFYFHLKEASENPNKPLAGLQHSVYGNGDETYIDTYMNVPRMVDTLLERAGSRRFYARAETGEQFKPLEDEMIEAAVWAPGMWKAMME